MSGGEVSPQSPFPVYDLAQFGEDVYLYFLVFNSSATAITPTTEVANRQLTRDAASMTASTNFEQAGGGAVSTYDATFQYLTDMPAWVFVLASKLVAGITVGAGDTLSLSARLLIIANYAGGGTKTLKDTTLTRAGIGGGTEALFEFGPTPAQEFMPQYTTITVRVVITATRTAGINTEIAGLKNQGLVLTATSHIFLHIHADKNHGDQVLGGTRKI